MPRQICVFHAAGILRAAGGPRRAVGSMALACQACTALGCQRYCSSWLRGLRSPAHPAGCKACGSPTQATCPGPRGRGCRVPACQRGEG